MVDETADEAQRIAAFRERNGLTALIDVHTHFMPQNVLDKVWSYFGAAGPKVGRPWPITYRDDEARRLEQLRSFGVTRFTSMLYPHRAGMAPWLNAWAADFAARTPDVLHTATFFPEQGVAEYVDEAITSGARVFKAHVQVGDYDPRDPLLDEVWAMLADRNIPVVAHCGNGPVPGTFTGAEIMAEVLRQHPRLPLIVAHLGDPQYDDFLDLALEHERVYLDTTMTFTDFVEEVSPFPRASIGRLRDAQHRILLGTDFPNIPYPYAHQLESLERLDLGEEWVRDVCFANAADLFGVS